MRPRGKPGGGGTLTCSFIAIRSPFRSRRSQQSARWLKWRIAWRVPAHLLSPRCRCGEPRLCLSRRFSAPWPDARFAAAAVTLRNTAHSRCAISATAQRCRAHVYLAAIVRGAFAPGGSSWLSSLELRRAPARPLLKVSSSIDAIRITRSRGPANLHGLRSARADYQVQLHADQCITRLAARDPPGPTGREAAIGVALPGLLECL